MTQVTPPVGPDFGLEPRQNRDLIVPPLSSEDILTSTEDYRTGSEFGGVAGLVQPPPHVPTAHERLMQIYRIDPQDDGSRPDSVAPPELTGDF